MGKKQGKVFKNAIDAGVMSIMTTHVAFPAVDDAMLYGKPISSTLSKKVITGLLREKMGFEGLIITDDIGMGGIATACPRTEGIIRAINAGHDIILSVKPHEFDVIIEAVKNGEIPMSRIDESCERILKAKEMIGLFDENDEWVDKTAAKKLISDSSKKITEKALTLLYDRNNLLPVSREHVKEVAIVCIAHDTDTIKKLELMKMEFEKRGANAIIYDGIDYANCEEIFSKDLIVYTGYIFQHNPMGMPSFYGEKMRCFFKAFSKGNEKSLGISLGYPYIHFDAMQGANTFINAYSRDPRTLEALVKAIYGEIEFTGTSPIDIEPKLRLVYC